LFIEPSLYAFPFIGESINGNYGISEQTLQYTMEETSEIHIPEKWGKGKTQVSPVPTFNYGMNVVY
jgi:hypothetical protein